MQELEIVAKAFVEKWTHPNYRPRPISPDEIISCEKSLGITFPASYKFFLSNFGCGGTNSELLSSIVNNELEINDLSDIHSIEEVISSTESWHNLGLGEDFISIASDSMGNLFCFNRHECSGGVNDAPIWFFDHDFETTEKIYGSLLEWLEDLVAIEKENA